MRYDEVSPGKVRSLSFEREFAVTGNHKQIFSLRGFTDLSYLSPRINKHHISILLALMYK